MPSPSPIQDGIFLSLGSNLGDRRRWLDLALLQLSEQGIETLHRSRLYLTEPVEQCDQPPFFNLACRVGTALQPLELLESCLRIEREMGRVRSVEKGPRIIDIDLLYYGQLVVNSQRLTLPHPRLASRNFVLAPLEEIAPDFRDPVSRRSVSAMRRACPDLSAVRPLLAE